MQRHRGIPLAEAAKHMGLSTIALRRRAERGTVEAYKTDDRWYVVVPDGTVPIQGPVRTDPRLPATDSAAVATLREELAFLRGKVDAIPILERELESRARETQAMREEHAREIQELHVLLQNTQRLIPATIPDAPQSPERAGDDQSRATTPNTSHSAPQRERTASQPPRSWWRRLLDLG